MLEINTNCTKIVKQVANTDLIIVDNFLLSPEKVVEYLYNNQPKFLWKHEDQPSNNGKYFIDKRHDISGLDTYIYNCKISSLLEKSNQKLIDYYTTHSNFTRFIDHGFNDYKNCYWYPHTDYGYTALLYLNIYGCNGTNIYDNSQCDNYNEPEHYKPWRPKNRYKLLYTIESKFNRLVIFDGLLLHGMAINDDRFFNSERINLVTFFSSM